MQYMLMIYSGEQDYSKLDQAVISQQMAAYEGFVQALRTAGVWSGMGRLQASSTATTVRVSNGKSQVLNGPFADSKEQLGGYFIVDVSDLDAAISWAARCPGSSHGVVEVRPLWPMPTN